MSRETNPAMLEKRIYDLERGGGGGVIEHLEEVIESIDNSLIADVSGNDEHFHFDNKNGVYGFNTDEERGAETFKSFGVNCEMLYSADTVETNIEIDSMDNYKAIVFMSYYVEQNHKVWCSNFYPTIALSDNDTIGVTSDSKYLWYNIIDSEHLSRFVTGGGFAGVRIIGIK